jgi:hypothetical protein
MAMELPTVDTAKSFWSRPEGKVGALILLLIAGLGIYEYSLILPWFVTMLEDTVHMVFLGCVLVAMGWLLFSKTSHMMFRVLMRVFTGLFVSVYPIEIIEDKLTEMKKRRDKMNAQISEVSGQIVTLQRVMTKNHQDAVQGFNMAHAAQDQAARASDDAERLRKQLQIQANARKAQRRENANVGYATLLQKLQGIYSFLSKYAAHIDFFIDDTTDEVEQKKIEYKTTNTAFGAMTMAMKVMKGNATEEDIYGQAMDYIESDVSRKLGIMDDLQRVSQNFMDGLDVQEGAVDTQALQALNDYEHKLLTSGDTELAVMLPGSTPQKVPVARGSVTTMPSFSNSGGDDYSSLLK